MSILILIGTDSVRDPHSTIIRPVSCNLTQIFTNEYDSVISPSDTAIISSTFFFHEDNESQRAEFGEFVHSFQCLSQACQAGQDECDLV